VFVKGQLNRDLVIEKAAELIETVGLDEMTLSRLAKELGIKSASLYNHIGSINDLRSSLTAKSMQLLGEACRNAVVGKSGDEAILAMAYAYRKFAKMKPQLYKAFMQNSLLSQAERIQHGALLTQTLERLMEPYGYNEKEALHIARGIRVFLFGFVYMGDGGFFKSTKASVDMSFEYLMKELIAHIRDHQVESGKKPSALL
jgi:AcrR family transcriptional regulator